MSDGSSTPTDSELRRAWKKVEEAKAANPMAFDQGREHHSARSTAQYVHDRVEEAVADESTGTSRKTIITGAAAKRASQPSFAPAPQTPKPEFQALDATQLGYVTKNTGIETPVQVSVVPTKGSTPAPRIIGRK